MGIAAGMMGKRALVVDDSRSSRAFLAKLLEEQQIAVDAAETAEQAIDYLAQHRPDVIFMDHLMPGMDGFQAMQAIKKDPRTAGIPILMYTSQEGELYLGQARALGAAGVLRKGAAGTEVRALLDGLQLAAIPESAIIVTPPQQQENAVLSMSLTPVAGTSEPPAAPSPVLLPALEQLIQAQTATVQAHFDAAIAALGERQGAELRALREALPSPAPVVEAPPVIEPEKPRHSPVPWVLTVLASIAAAVLGTLFWRNDQELVAVRAELANTKADVELLTARLVPPPPPVPEQPAEAAATAMGTEAPVPVAAATATTTVAAPVAITATAVPTATEPARAP